MVLLRLRAAMPLRRYLVFAFVRASSRLRSS